MCKSEAKKMSKESSLYTLKRTGREALEFRGWELKSTYTSSDQAFSDFSGETGISHDITLYLTEKNLWVIEFEHNTQWQGSVGHINVYYGESLNNVMDEVPDCRAKELSYIEFGEYLTPERI